MEAKKISLDDFVLSGGGANGESYDSKTDPGIMLKLYFPGKIEQPLSELILAQKVYSLGVPTPKPGEYVMTEDGRYGIIFNRIRDKKSYARATGDNPEKAAQYAREFARMCLQLHSIHVDTTQFISTKSRYMELLENSPFYSTAEKDRIGRFIGDMPDTDLASHGDLQYGNAIFTGDRRYFIDLGDFGYGSTLLDVSMMFMCSVLVSDSFVQEGFHMTKDVSKEFWKHFAGEYFGTDRPLADINEMLMPYAAVKNLLVETYCNCPMPEYRVALKYIL